MHDTDRAGKYRFILRKVLYAARYDYISRGETLFITLFRYAVVATYPGQIGRSDF